MQKNEKNDGYGYSLENPVHVAGFDEERIYMEHLCRVGERKPVRARRLGSNISRTTNHPTDLYEIEPSGFASRPDVIYIDLYGESDWRAPEGYTLSCDRPLREGGEQERPLGDELQDLIRAVTRKIT